MARQGLKPFRVTVARWMRRRLEFAWIAYFIRRQVTFEIDNFSHVQL
jgi:hypothetical protein